MLEPFTGERKKLRKIVYDGEWYPKTYKPRLFGAYDGDEYRSYETMTEFLDNELTSENRGATFFAHAGGLADVQFVLEEVIRRDVPDLRVTASFSGSSAIIVKIARGKNVWTFCDSFWLLRDSLAKIGRSLGLEKTGEWTCPEYPHCGHPLKKSGDPTCIFYAPMAVLREYNERDCVILYRAIERLEDELLELGGALRKTIASSALFLFRSAFLKDSIPTSKTINETCRSAYVASRVEPFLTEIENAEYFDVNSSFPFSMTQPQPAALMATRRSWSPGEMAMIDAKVTVPEMYIPPVPYRTENGRVFFPTGRMRRWFMNVDLELLMEAGGRIERIYEVKRFHTFTDLGDYVRIIYERRRKEKDTFRKLVYKYLLNSLYGKFGESSEKEEMLIRPAKVPECRGYPECRKRCQCVRALRAGIFLVKKYREIPHAHFPISASVTANSRAILTRGLWAADSPAYCDTDSITCKSDLGDSDALGAFKHEKSIARGVFAAPKLYKLIHAETCGCDKCKGKGGLVEIRAKGFSMLTEKEFDTLLAGGAVEYERMARLRELYRLGEFEPRDEQITKYVRGAVVPKRARVEGTADTRPWTMKEIGE